MSNTEETDKAIQKLSAKYHLDPARIKDLGVMRAFQIQVASTAAIFRFYRLRAEGIHASRVLRERTAALASIDAMTAVANKERARTTEMIALSKADGRLGFHAEATKRLYDP
jgi:hypothetical protein